jgi:hypothetical protein
MWGLSLGGRGLHICIKHSSSNLWPISRCVTVAFEMTDFLSVKRWLQVEMLSLGVWYHATWNNMPHLRECFWLCGHGRWQKMSSGALLLLPVGLLASILMYAVWLVNVAARWLFDPVSKPYSTTTWFPGKVGSHTFKVCSGYIVQFPHGFPTRLVMLPCIRSLIM